MCVCAAGGTDWTMNSYILSNEALQTERVQETAPSYLDLVLTARTLDCVADVNRAQTLKLTYHECVTKGCVS